MVIVYVFVDPFSAVTKMGIEFVPTSRVIFGDGAPEVAGEPLIVNVAVESSIVAVIVVSAVPIGADAS